MSRSHSAHLASVPVNAGSHLSLIFLFMYVFFNLFMYSFIYCLFVLFRAAPVAYRGSQARGLIRAVAASLCHSHSNARSEPRL